MSIHQKTLFIIGAGASKEANLPVGAELKKLISKVLDIRFDDFGHDLKSGDRIICGAFHAAVQNKQGRDINPYLHSCWHIRDAMPQAISIDNFIDTHSNDERIELCGKLAIVRTILDAETNSSMYLKQPHEIEKLKFQQFEATWYNSFWQLLTENCKASELEQRLGKVAFVIFNYDRCIEHYLYHALQNYYKMSASEASDILKHLEIYHPYGTVGSLPWMAKSNTIGFGAPLNSQQLLKLAGQIRTFTEGTDESSSEVLAIRSNMTASTRLIFLGFAFHPLNMELLLPSTTAPSAYESNRIIFATAHGISKSDAYAISGEFKNKVGLNADNIHIRNDLTCNQLFQEYRRGMSFVR